MTPVFVGFLLYNGKQNTIGKGPMETLFQGARIIPSHGSVRYWKSRSRGKTIPHNLDDLLYRNRRSQTVIGKAEEDGMYRPRWFSNHCLRLLNTIDDWCRLAACKSIILFCRTEFPTWSINTNTYHYSGQKIGHLPLKTHP